VRAFVLIYISILLVIIDRLSTWIALEENLGEESNPHVDTESLMTLFLSPVPLSLSMLFLVWVVITEVYTNKVHSLLSSKNPLAPMCLMPLFFIWMMSIVCLSNLFGAMGLGTPLPWFASLFDFITEDRHELAVISLAILNVAGLPLLTKVGLKIYAPNVCSSTADISSGHILQRGM